MLNPSSTSPFSGKMSGAIISLLRQIVMQRPRTHPQDVTVLEMKGFIDPVTPDRLAKLRPMLTYLNEKFQPVYIPYGDMTIDKSMVKFKGRLGFQQCMPAKPIKCGIKVWCLAESSTGYMDSGLYHSGICAAETVRLNRKFLPKDLLPKAVRLEKHQFHVAQAQQLMHTIWMDTKAVIQLPLPYIDWHSEP
ncbi:PiggyBac transposable element-derived protein 4-like [Plakobranchus ocellatus]|uniref:PiggyBac transposable element-derived protein 4-like n=1 Tax=Plakobranchus ocellatus TaxID=259542 RepID=A0AAV4BKM8_9GAST|nr:PiggyBac transposable element-derived protein 4-like [Plakobranchus ocellatus]